MGLMAPHTFCFFPTKLYLKIPCDSLHKSYLQEFWNFKFNFKKDCNLILWPMGKWKIANILEMSSRRTNRAKFWLQGQFMEYVCNFWHFGQCPSFMPQNGNFENGPVSRKLLPIEGKQAQFRTLGVEKGYMCNLWNSGQWPNFRPKYGNFENQSLSLKRLPVERK